VTAVVPNPPGIAALRSAVNATGALRPYGERIEARAKALAPVRSGEYRDSIHTSLEDGRIVVAADVEYAVFVELGTSDTPTFAVLRRAVEAV
jgi:hypothetical protein